MTSSRHVVHLRVNGFQYSQLATRTAGLTRVDQNCQSTPNFNAQMTSVGNTGSRVHTSNFSPPTTRLKA